MKRFLLAILTAAFSLGIYFLVRHLIDDGIVTDITVGDKDISLAAPVWLYGLTVIPWLFWLTTFSLTDLSRAQHGLQSTIRGLVVAAVFVALARPTSTAKSSKVAIAVLVDVSESVSTTQIDAAKQYIDEMNQRKDSDTKLFVVSFAETPRLVEQQSGKWNIDRHKADAPASDLQAALHLAYGLFPSGYVPHIVVLSDGHTTQGDLVAAANKAVAFDIPVSWAELPDKRAPELRIETIDAPDQIRAGEPFYVEVGLWSSHDQKASLFLQQDEFPNPLEPKKELTLPAGKTVVRFRSKAPRAGATRYTAKIVKPERDTEKGNNVASFAVPVIGKPHILYVEGGMLHDRSSPAYLRKALESQHIDVEVRGPRGLPSRLTDYEKYDMVVVSDVPAKLVSLGQMNALDAYVRRLGGGLVMAGGEDSFGSGGYQGTKMEKLLPVRFDSETIREQPNVAIVLVVDKSGSMSGDKMEAAKTSARATAEVLAAHDLIAVIAHDTRAETIVSLQRASNRMKISAEIGRIRPGGGTNIYPGLREAHNVLQTADAKVKHVIVLSDGQAPYNGIENLCNDMRASGITVHAVGIGSADKALLTLITDRGEGSLFFTQDLSRLPRIFAQVTREAQRSALVEERIFAKVVKRTALIEGTGVERAPALRGYVSTKVKPGADLVLRTNTGEPLLASWRAGTGQSVAWTSDVKNRWGVDWLRWGGYSKFYAQLVRSSMRRKTYDSYDISSSIQGDNALVVVNALDNDDRFVNDLDTELELIDPKSKKVIATKPMPQTASGRYEASFSLPQAGSVLARAVHKREGKKVAESTTAVTIPYPREFSTTGQNHTQLNYLAQATSGKGPLPAPAAATVKARKPILFTSELWPWMMLFAGGILIIDLFAKRVRLFGYRVIKFE